MTTKNVFLENTETHRIRNWLFSDLPQR